MVLRISETRLHPIDARVGIGAVRAGMGGEELQAIDEDLRRRASDYFRGYRGLIEDLSARCKYLELA